MEYQMLEQTQRQSIALRSSRFCLPQKPTVGLVSINDLVATPCTMVPRETATTEVRTVFGVGAIKERRSDGVTVVEVGGLTAFLQPGNGHNFTTDVDKLNAVNNSTQQPQATRVHRDGKEFVVHHVMPTDTLQGLCIRYSTSLKTLKKYNDFPSKVLHSCMSVWSNRNLTTSLFQDFSVCDFIQIPAGSSPSAVVGNRPTKQPVQGGCNFHKHAGAHIPSSICTNNRKELALVRAAASKKLACDRKDARSGLRFTRKRVGSS